MEDWMKIGMVSTGKIAMEFGRAVGRLEGARCAAVCSRSEETGQAFARELGMEGKVYTELEQLLDDSEVNFVYIAVPNSLHYDYAMRALRAGKNVICEKPLTATLKEAERLTGYAEERGLYLFEAITSLYSPNYPLLADKLPLLGEIRLAQFVYSQYSSRFGDFLEGRSPNVFNPEYAGGALMDLNVYNIHLAVGLFGLPERTVYFPNIRDNGIDTSGIAILSYPGMVCECLAAKDSGGVSEIQIQGEKGYIHIPGGSNGRKAFTLTLPEGEEHVDADDSGDRLLQELSAFADIYRRGDYPECRRMMEQSVKVMRVLQEARESAGLYFPSDR